MASVAIVDSTPEYLLFDLISLLLFVCCDFAIGYCVCRSGGELQSLKSIMSASAGLYCTRLGDKLSQAEIGHD